MKKVVPVNSATMAGTTPEPSAVLIFTSTIYNPFNRYEAYEPATAPIHYIIIYAIPIDSIVR